MKELDIINMALIRIGQPMLTTSDYTGETSPAPEARLFFPQAVETVLRRYPWAFALRSSKLNPIKGEDNTYKSTLPDGWANITKAYSHGFSVEDFNISEGRIICDAPVDKIEGTIYPEDFDLCDPLFVDCVSLRLASYLAGAICQSPDMAANLMQEYNQLAFPQATTADAKDSRERGNSRIISDISHSILLRSRR